LVNRVNISAGSIRFLIDNARMMGAGWACDAADFANNRNLADAVGAIGDIG
jgi:hypothetical protein